MLLLLNDFFFIIILLFSKLVPRAGHETLEIRAVAA